MIRKSQGLTVNMEDWYVCSHTHVPVCICQYLADHISAILR